MKGARQSVGWALLLVLMAPLGAAAQHPMGIVDLINIPRISDPQLSPDGRFVLYTQSAPDWKASRRISHIWRAAVAGGEAVQLTTGAEGESAPRWAPDGQSIAFIAKRGSDEVAQLYLLPAAGGEARALTSHATAVTNPRWAPDGASMYFVAAEPKPSEDRARDRVRDDVFAFEETYKQNHLWRVAVANRAETRITSGEFSVSNYDLSSDGRRIAHRRQPTPLLDSNDEGEVWVMNADGSGTARLTTNAVSESSIGISPDGAQVLFVADANAEFEWYHNGRLFVIPAAGGAPRAIVGENEPYDVEEAAWSKDGKSIYLLVALGARQELFVVPAAGGKARKITDGRHVVANLAVSGDRLALTIADPTNAGDVWMMAAGDAAPRRITRVYDYLAGDFKLGRQETIQWKGADGVVVEGVLTYPVDYQPGRPYPLSVMTHGGPQSADRFGIGSPGYAIQVLAGKGYAVLQPNYRGSTGYGDEFLRDMIGHYFQNAHLDVMAGVDELVRRGIADPDKLVKSGWSAGGHMTNKLITFTDRFKAASSGAGAANWISMYAQSDIRFTRTAWFDGTPWQSDAPIDAYWSSSPLKDVAKVKTPTLFFVGERDERVPLPQSIEMHRALKSNGVPTRLYVAPREPHSWTEPRHLLFRLNAELEWFDKYALDRPYTWEKAPDDTAKPALRPTTAQEP